MRYVVSNLIFSVRMNVLPRFLLIYASFIVTDE